MNYHCSNSMPSANSPLTVLTCALLALASSIGCGTENRADDALLIFIDAPSIEIIVNTPKAVSYQVHTEGELHHTEVRACMGTSDTCGLGDASSFDLKFPAIEEAGMYDATIIFDTAGPWTIAAFAHVGETPHNSAVVHTTVLE